MLYVRIDSGGNVVGVHRQRPVSDLTELLLEVAGDTVVSAGWTYANGEFTPPPPPPPMPATADDVTAERDRRMSAFPFGGKSYQLDADSQANISGAGTLALAAIINGSQPGDYRWSDADADFYWLAADNTPTVLDAQTVFAFAQAAAAWKRDHIYAARVIKNLSPIPADFADDSRWPTV